MRDMLTLGVLRASLISPGPRPARKDYFNLYVKTRSWMLTAHPRKACCPHLWECCWQMAYSWQPCQNGPTCRPLSPPGVTPLPGCAGRARFSDFSGLTRPRDQEMTAIEKMACYTHRSQRRALCHATGSMGKPQGQQEA